MKHTSRIKDETRLPPTSNCSTFLRLCDEELNRAVDDDEGAALHDDLPRWNRYLLASHVQSLSICRIIIAGYNDIRCGCFKFCYPSFFISIPVRDGIQRLLGGFE